MKIYYYIILASLIVLYSCKTESPVDPENKPGQGNYTKIYDILGTNIKLELYNGTANRLVSGYNDLGFKVFVNNQEKTDGFIKFFPKMYHFLGSPMHSSPTSPNFSFDPNKGMFMGYASFLMISDTSSFWYGYFNYNNTTSIDSFFFTVDTASFSQIRHFVDFSAGLSYFLTLVSPFNPRQGPNVLQCLMHFTNDDINYTQVNNAEMFIRPWMENMGHGSANNVNPVYKSGGIYEGTANFNMSGMWYVYDSIKVNGSFVTPSPPPKFIFDVP